MSRLVGSTWWWGWHIAAAIKLAGDGVCDIAQLLLLLLEVLHRGVFGVLLKPICGLLNSFQELRSISLGSQLENAK